MRQLYVIDPPERINVKKDTTLAFMLEAQRRGHDIEIAQVGDLVGDLDGAIVQAAPVRVQRKEGSPIVAEPARVRPLGDFDVVFMRKDPPFTLDYIYATYLLELVDPTKTLVVNRPSGLRNANEKVFALRFPDVIPPTRVTKSPEMIRSFVEEQGGRAVVKPLDLMGGIGIFLLDLDDPNFNSIVETSTEEGTEFVMVQRYLPEAKEGDKRVILLDGKPLGAVLRVPKRGELRGNFHVGGTAQKSEITARDREIVDAVAPALAEEGLWFVGLDVIGGYLTEVNVTSPTGVQEIDRLDDVCIEADVMDWVEERVARLGG